jgi:hypothetical protein
VRLITVTLAEQLSRQAEPTTSAHKKTAMTTIDATPSVAVRLAGVGTFEIAHAGNPSCQVAFATHTFICGVVVRAQKNRHMAGF